VQSGPRAHESTLRDANFVLHTETACNSTLIIHAGSEDDHNRGSTSMTALAV